MALMAFGNAALDVNRRRRCGRRRRRRRGVFATFPCNRILYLRELLTRSGVRVGSQDWLRRDGRRGVDRVWVGDLAGNLRRALLDGCFAPHLRVGVACGLTLGGGVGFGDLALFAASGGFGDGCGFGAAGGFDAFCCGGACCLFGFAQSTSHGGVGVFGLMSAGGLGGLTRGGVSGRCSGFGFGLGEQGLFANLLGGAMSQLRAILSARGGEVAILCSMKICPGVEDRHIFRGLRYCRIHRSCLVPARIHSS